MSIPALQWALAQPLKAPTKSVLLILAWHHNGQRADDTVWPCVRTIQFEVGISRRTVHHCLHELRDLGLITVREPGGGRRRSVVYALHQDVRKDQTSAPGALFESENGAGDAPNREGTKRRKGNQGEGTDSRAWLPR